jgi:hypothetical protein
MSDDARVWRVYNDEAERVDAEMVEGWRSILDTLLIFVRFDILPLYYSSSMTLLFNRLVFSQPW